MWDVPDEKALLILLANSSVRPLSSLVNTKQSLDFVLSRRHLFQVLASAGLERKLLVLCQFHVRRCVLKHEVSGICNHLAVFVCTGKCLFFQTHEVLLTTCAVTFLPARLCAITDTIAWVISSAQRHPEMRSEWPREQWCQTKWNHLLRRLWIALRQLQQTTEF